MKTCPDCVGSDFWFGVLVGASGAVGVLLVVAGLRLARSPAGPNNIGEDG